MATLLLAATILYVVSVGWVLYDMNRRLRKLEGATRLYVTSKGQSDD